MAQNDTKRNESKRKEETMKNYMVCRVRVCIALFITVAAVFILAHRFALYMTIFWHFLYSVRIYDFIDGKTVSHRMHVCERSIMQAKGQKIPIKLKQKIRMRMWMEDSAAKGSHTKRH